MYIALTGQNSAENNSAAIAEEVLERTAGHKVMGLVWEAFTTVWVVWFFFISKSGRKNAPLWEHTTWQMTTNTRR